MKLSFFYVAILMFGYGIIGYAQEAPVKPGIRMTGEVTRPLTLTMDDLLKMKAVTVNVKDKAGTGHSYKGVNIQDILGAAGVTINKQLTGKNLTKYLLVKCADGYEIVFSLAELDSSFTDRIITLAYESDGKPLSAEDGPFKLIVPGEKKAARSGRQVTTMVVQFAKE